MAGSIEQGTIYFVYIPRIDTDQDPETEGMRSLYMVLVEDGSDKRRIFFTDEVDVSVVNGGGPAGGCNWIPTESSCEPMSSTRALRPLAHETSALDSRNRVKTIPIGKGRYWLFEHPDTTLIEYRLTNPEEAGDAQISLGIQAEGAYVIPEQRVFQSRSVPRKRHMSHRLVDWLSVFPGTQKRRSH